MQSIGEQLIGLDFSVVDGIVMKLPCIYDGDLVLLAHCKDGISDDFGLFRRPVVSKLVGQAHGATSS